MMDKLELKEIVKATIEDGVNLYNLNKIRDNYSAFDKETFKCQVEDCEHPALSYNTQYISLNDNDGFYLCEIHWEILCIYTIRKARIMEYNALFAGEYQTNEIEKLKKGDLEQLDKWLSKENRTIYPIEWIRGLPTKKHSTEELEEELEE